MPLPLCNCIFMPRFSPFHAPCPSQIYRADRRAIRRASRRFTRPLSVLLTRPPESWCSPSDTSCPCSCASASVCRAFAVSRALPLADLCAVLSAALLAVSRARSACCSQGRPNAGAPPSCPCPSAAPSVCRVRPEHSRRVLAAAQFAVKTKLLSFHYESLSAKHSARHIVRCEM